MALDIQRLTNMERILMREAFDIACLSLGLSQSDRRLSNAATLSRIAAVIQTQVEQGHSDVREIADAAVRDIAPPPII